MGKSTLLNNLLGTKVAITSPAPQTTRQLIRAVLTEPSGQIVFIDTPGVFAKVREPVSKKINLRAREAFGEADIILYLIDHTRKRQFEENRVLGLIRKFEGPKVLVINKIDIKRPTFRAQYRFMEEEFDEVVEISALQGKHLKRLKEILFEFLPESDKYLIDSNELDYPLVDMSSKEFIAELIREKAFLNLRQELPYTITVVVEEISERLASSQFKEDLLRIKARILTTDERYKRMIIGAKGQMIKQIGYEARRELETATGKKVYLELRVETDRHWPERLL